MILVVGSINMDIVLNVHDIPSPGQTVMSKAKNTFPGGKGANQAVAAAKMGADVTMLGCVGNDQHGTELLASMKRAGVNTDHILIAESADTSSAYICVSSSGENAIVVDSSANMLVTPEYIAAHEDLFEAADYCLIQMEIPHETVKKAINLSHLHSTKVVLNPSPLDMFNLALLDGVEYVIPNEEEAASLLYVDSINELTYDDFIHFLRCQAIRNLVITLGENGALHYNVTGNFAQYPTLPQKAVDTTGAGDTFLGAFVAALDAGNDCNYAIRFANAAASLSVMRPGAQSSMPTYNETMDFSLISDVLFEKEWRK